MNPGLVTISDNQWDQLREWAEVETGMVLSGTRFPRLQNAVIKVFTQEMKGQNPSDVLDHPDQRARLLELVTGHLTIGESFFFRNEHHFQALREHVIPAILARNAESKEIRIWSAGCATGEEPYSLAILLDQLLPNRREWQVSILGTDLNPLFLEHARQGNYRDWSFRLTDINHSPHYFLRQEDLWQLQPRIRDSVRFSYLNLVKDVYPSPLTGTVGLDLILFRNVAIYLKQAVTRAILQRFQQALRPGGWLLLGEVELPMANVQGLKAERFGSATFHQKSPDAASLSVCIPPSAPPAMAEPSHRPLPGLEIPEWVPLPFTNSASIAPRETPMSGFTATATKGWEDVERSLGVAEYNAAEVALTHLANVKERAELRLRYVRALLNVGEPQRARQMLELCLRENPLLIEAQLLKGTLAEEAGNLEDAEQCYRRALYLDRNSPIVHFHLGIILQRKGDFTAAAKSLQTTWNLSQNRDPHALVEYGEGVCYGRFREMLLLLKGEPNE